MSSGIFRSCLKVKFKNEQNNLCHAKMYNLHNFWSQGVQYNGRLYNYCIIVVLVNWVYVLSKFNDA